MRNVIPLLILATAIALPASAKKPSATEARAFLAETESRLLELWVQRERANWVMSTNITHDTEIIASKGDAAVMAYVAARAKAATRYDKVALNAVDRRKMTLLKRAITLPAPADKAKRDRLVKLSGEMQSMYGKGKYCATPKDCKTLAALSGVLATSQDEAALRDAWVGWRTISAPMRARYVEYAAIANSGAKELGFADVGALWRSQYDMDPDDFAKEVDRLWSQVKPLYDNLHCLARRKLTERYGASIVQPGKPIPAHLFGNMWAQDWTALYDVMKPEKSQTPWELAEVFEKKKIDEVEMVRMAERFFVSMGLQKLPETFWKRSMFTRPRDREVMCHASAWDVDWKHDLRIKMCIEKNEEDFTTIHHELGHNYYQRAYSDQPALFTDSANDGFHEALGDVLALSVTPRYLVEIGLLDKTPKDSLNPLMKRALEKVAFLPFGLVVDRWRWEVFGGKVAPNTYNAAWWRLRQKYQGIRPPVARGEKHFDPGSKYHIATSVPYTRYFLASILQFQFHRALCTAAGHKGPLHQCSIYGNKEAGRRLKEMMTLGLSKPWPEALAVVTGQKTMDATALIDYFAPLQRWLEKQNAGQACGW